MGGGGQTPENQPDPIFLSLSSTDGGIAEVAAALVAWDR